MCLWISLRLVARIQKEVNDFKGEYEGTEVQKPHTDRSENSRTFGEIQFMVDNLHPV